ncbi:pyrroline-5-carboxylate reductase [Arthrobacter tecti]
MSNNISQHIAFLGCGSMNGAILTGLLAAGVPSGQVTATVRDPEKAADLAKRHGVQVLSSTAETEANRRAAGGADVVLLGVKPVGILDLAREISPALKPGTVVISVAAAISIDMLESALPEGQPVIRSMPNTPSSLGRGVLSISAGAHATDELMEQARTILSAAGTVVEIPEDQVDALSAVSGSGPAYAFYLAEAMAAAGVKLGLDEDLAKLLATQTVAGAGYMLAEEGADATALRKAVTSPNGTTERAIATFDEQGLPDIVAAGARAAAERAGAITKELDGR